MEYNPIHDTTYSTNDSPMHEVDRDELSKAHMELDSAHTTIKNLSEVVVKFSHMGNTAHQELERTVKVHQPTPKTPTPPPITTPTSNWTKSANPMIIKLTRNNVKQPLLDSHCWIYQSRQRQTLTV